VHRVYFLLVPYQIQTKENGMRRCRFRCKPLTVNAFSFGVCGLADG